MSTIAFIGLGIMGGPMAVHLAKAGHRRRRLQPFAAARRALWSRPAVRAADSIAKAVAGADVVAVMVPDSPDVQAVLAGENGVFDNAPAGALIIDFSSIRPDVTTALAAQAAERGFRLIDAPVSGGEAGAINAALSIMVGGAQRISSRQSRSSMSSGKPLCTSGPNGSGQTVKAANQLIVAGQHPAARRGDRLPGGLRCRHRGRAGGTRRRAGRLGRPESEGKKMLDRSFDPGFRIELHHKDLGIVTAAAREAGVVIATRRRRRPTHGLRASEWRWRA